MTQTFTIETQQFPFILKDFDFLFIKENGFIAICPVLANITELYKLKTTKSFFDYERVGSSKEFMDELFSTSNRGYRRTAITRNTGERNETEGYEYFSSLGDRPDQPIPQSELPDFNPLYYRLNASTYALEPDQSINRKKSALYFVHPTLFQAICIWADPRYAVKAFEVVHAYAKHKRDIAGTDVELKHEAHMRKLDEQYQQNIEIEKKRVARYIEKRRQLAIQHNELVDRFNRQEELHAQDRQAFQIARAEDRSRHEALLAAFDGVTIKNAKILAALSNLRRDLAAAPVVNLNPSTRSFDVVNKPPARQLVSFLALNKLVVTSADSVYHHYIVNRAQLRSIKKQIAGSVARILKRYENIQYNESLVSLYFDSNGYAIQAWNVLKSKGLVLMNGSELQLRDGYTIKSVLRELNSITLDPDAEVEIVRKEFERLQAVTDPEERKFLEEFEEAI